MLGCHYGSLYTEPAAGMAGLLAISEAVGKAFPSGTQRKVIFSAWAAGEYGMIGSTEFAQVRRVFPFSVVGWARLERMGGGGDSCIFDFRRWSPLLG